MTDDDTERRDGSESGTVDDRERLPVRPEYKVIGELDDRNGIGVLGRNTAGSGTPIGVKGEAPTDVGYGISTPDDARVEGEVAATSGHTLTVGGRPTLELGPHVPDVGNNDFTAGGNVVAGYEGNSAGTSNYGVTISGGGRSGQREPRPHLRDLPRRPNTNVVTGNSATIGGGWNNRAGKEATVAGGLLNTASGQRSTIGGGITNYAPGFESTIGGGFGNVADGTVAGGRNNLATGNHSTVGGGRGNSATGDEATVAGGEDNTASGKIATVGGGEDNSAKAWGATVAGGGDDAEGNEALDRWTAVGGGRNNRAGTATSGTQDASYATVAGGRDNEAAAEYGFAVGRSNQVTEAYGIALGREASADHRGALVWGDSSGTSVSSGAPDEVTFQAGGGVAMYSNSDQSTGALLFQGDGSWSSVSSRAAKTDLSPVDPDEVLSGVEDLEVARWRYEGNESATHMGPMAEEFSEAFGLGHDDEHITNVDADGVALAAVQGLARRLEERDERIDALETENERLRAETEALRDRVSALEDRLPAEADE